MIICAQNLNKGVFMKILVIEDGANNIEIAKKLLAEHDLSVISDPEKAFELLDASNKKPFDFDVVLTDMLMPAVQLGQIYDKWSKFVNSEMPFGIMFTLMAAKRGTKYVGLLTSGSHHDHPMSAGLDFFPLEKVFKIDDSKVVFCREINQQVEIEGRCERCNGSGKDPQYNQACCSCRGDGKNYLHGKGWGELLAKLIK